MLRKIIISCVLLNMTLNLRMRVSGGGAGMASGEVTSNVAGRIGLGLGASLEAGLKYGGTQNYQLKPRYITQKMLRKPKVITQTEIRPVFQRTINRPSILRETYLSVPNLVQSETKVSNRKRMMDAANSVANLSKTVNVPGNTVFVQPVITPTLLIRNEKVRVAPSDSQTRRLNPVILPTKRTFASESRTVNVPGGNIYNKTYLQPVLTREFVRVNVQRQAPKRINHRTIIAPVVIQNKVRNKRVIVPGRRIMNQTIIQPRHTTQRVRVNLIHSKPIQIRRKAIIKPTLKTRRVRKKYHNIVYKVPIQRTITKVKPHIVKVDDIRTTFVPVDEEGNELSGAAAASVLDTEGFVFGQAGYAKSLAGQALSGSIDVADTLGDGDMSDWNEIDDMPATNGFESSEWKDVDTGSFEDSSDMNGDWTAADSAEDYNGAEVIGSYL